MSVSEQLAFLKNSFFTFWDFGINFDYVLLANEAVIQYRQFLNLVSDDFLNVLRTNVLTSLTDLMIFSANLDPKNTECRKTGVIMGALMRKLFSFQFRD